MGLDDVLGAAGGLGDLGKLADIAKLAAENPEIIKAAAALLSPSDTSVGGPGGLAGLVGAFDANGLGDIMQSWTGTGDNAGIGADQLVNVLGNDAVADFATKAGIGLDDAGPALAAVLPGLIDQLSPQGRAPQGADLDDALGGLLGALR